MAGQGFGPGGTTQQSYAPTTGATTGNSASSTTPTTPPATASPAGLLQEDNSTSGFQLAPTSQVPGMNIMGQPSWMQDWTKAGSPDLNTWYQQQQGGYHNMAEAAPTPAQLQFAPPPPPAAPAAPAAAAAAPPQQPAGNWYTPKSGPAPAVTKNTLWGSSPVGQAELDALPDAFVSSQSFLNQYGSSPSAIQYQQWRMGAPAYFDQIARQDRTNTQNLFANVNRGGGG